MCGFASTNLVFILRSRGIKTVALGGFLTNCCVESTMRTAYEKGYDVITLKDCTATLSEEEQRLSIPELTEAIRRTQPNVAYIPDRPEIVTYLAERLQPGDVALFMSSGGLEDLIEGLLGVLRAGDPGR